MKFDYLKNDVYNKFLANSKGFGSVDIESKSQKKQSFSFKKIGSEKKIATLERVFRISKGELNKFSGSLNKDILTLHSSALLALLFFYKVSDKNRITIERVEYKDVLFEVPNRVFESPSRVDVILISEDEKTLLFLESKFIEPDDQAASKSDGRKFEDYEDYYKNLSPYLVNKVYKNLNTVLVYDKSGENLIISDNFNTKRFYEGITQMIAHFIGLCKGPSGDKNYNYATLFESAENLILGEILFKFPNNMTEINGIIEDYMELYNGLAEVLNKPITKEKFKKVNNLKNNRKNNIDKISVLPNILFYQEILKENPKYKLNPKVKSYYQF